MDQKIIEISIARLAEIEKSEEEHFKITPLGLEITGTPSLEEWLKFIDVAWGIRRGASWAVGDAIIYAESRVDFGEKYTQALNSTKYDYDSLRNLVFVARRFEMSRRRDKLSWSHHSAVAKLPPRLQDRLLDYASVNEMGRDELREEVKALVSTLTSMVRGLAEKKDFSMARLPEALDAYQASQVPALLDSDASEDVVEREVQKLNDHVEALKYYHTRHEDAGLDDFCKLIGERPIKPGPLLTARFEVVRHWSRRSGEITLKVRDADVDSVDAFVEYYRASTPNKPLLDVVINEAKL